MLVGKRDPWTEFADPVDVNDQPASATASPAAPAPAPGQAPAQQPPANDEFSAIAEPAQVVDTTQTEQGFADQQPDQPAAKMSPGDEAEVARILSQNPLDTAASDARRFLASKGFSPGPATVDGFKGDNLDEIVEYRRRNGVVNKEVDYLTPKPTESVSEQPGQANALARGIADVPTMGFMDELYGVAQALKNPSGHGFEHDMNAAIDRYRGAVDSDEKEHPVARIVGQLFGGLGIPLTYEGTAAKAFIPAAREAIAGGATREAALAAGRAAAAKSVRNAMIRDGAYIGGAHGVGSGEGVEGRIGEGVTEAGLGAAGGAVTGAVGQAVAPKIGTAAARNIPKTEEQELMEAAERQGVKSILPADVGGPVTRRATSMITQTIAGGKPVIGRAQQMTDEAQAARDRIAAGIGQALEPEAAGQQAISGAKQAIRTTADDARVFYSQAEKLTVGERLDAPKAISALDRNIAELEETPGGAPGLSTLRSLRDDLAKGKLTVGGIRRMRTVARDQFMQQGLTGSDLERRVGQVLDAAADDVRIGLASRGLNHAADLFAKGDAAWRKRTKLIDEVIEPIIGKDGGKSGEQVIKTLTADLQGNNARAVRFLEALPESERANVRASVIGALGRSKAGKQGSEGTNFSLDTFLTNWNQIGETAKRAYFGSEARASLNDLAKIAEGTREAQGYRNMSNTGGVVGNLLTLFSGVGGVFTFAKVVGTQYALGRLLASPRFARWLARAPKAKDPKAYVDRLAGIARAEPAIAGDVLSIQQRLTEAFGTAPMKAAASGNEDSEQKPR